MRVPIARIGPWTVGFNVSADSFLCEQDCGPSDIDAYVANSLTGETREQFVSLDRLPVHPETIQKRLERRYIVGDYHALTPRKLLNA